MKALKIILYVLLGMAALLVVLGIFAAKDYHIERSIEIDAPRELVFEHVHLFKNFPKWSPWQSLDPKMTTSIQGTDGEVGAVYTWKGNDDVGAGSQTLKSVSPDRVDIEVHFTEPWDAISPSFIKMEEKGDKKEKTRVTWGFDMHIDFPWNGLAMFTNVDAGVGKDYERGLGNLKRICEEIAHKKYLGYEVAEAELPAKYYVGVRKVVAFPDIPAFFGANLPLAMGKIQEAGLQPAGPPSGLFWNYDEAAGTTDMAAVVSIATEHQFGDGLSVFPVAAGNALIIDYYGVYDSTGKAHYAMDAYMAEKKLRSIPPAIEEYVTDPGAEPDTSKWLTRVIYFVEAKE